MVGEVASVAANVVNRTGGMAAAAARGAAGSQSSMDRTFWEWLLRTVLGDTTSDVDLYIDGRATAEDISNAIDLAYRKTAPDSPERIAIVDALNDAGVFQPDDDPTFFYGDVGEEDTANLAVASEKLAARTGDAPAQGTAIPENQGLDRSFWEWALRTVLGDATSNIDFYVDGRATAEDYNNAIAKAYAATDPGSAERKAIIDAMDHAGLFKPTDDLDFWYGDVGDADISDLGVAAEAAQPTGGTPIPRRQREGTRIVGGQTIPASSRLVRVTGAAGTDAGELFYVVGNVYGVDMAYLVGDREDLNATFGSIAAFGSFETVTQPEFDASGALNVGLVDEILGAGESLQAQFDRDMRAVGLENPPEWVMADQTALVTYVSAINEGWSSERMWNAMSKTAAFGTRFAGFDVVMGQLGTSSLQAGVAEYLKREAGIRAEILSSRGPSADVSPGYISSLIGSGWLPAEVGELLAYEARVKANPEAMDNINDILAFQGLPTLNPDDFVSFLQNQDALTADPSFTPGELWEGINDALRFQALAEEGLNISRRFASDLGEGTSASIAAPGFFTDRARMAAIEVARNADDLELGRYGLERNDIIAAMFGEESPSGKATSEVSELLEKMGRERSKRATGFSSAAAYTDALGRLRVQGLSNL